MKQVEFTMNRLITQCARFTAMIPDEVCAEGQVAVQTWLRENDEAWEFDEVIEQRTRESYEDSIEVESIWNA